MVCCALALIGIWAGIAKLSAVFSYAENQEERPIFLFTGLYLLTWVVFAVAMRLAPRCESFRALAWIVIAGGVMRLVMLGAEPIQETDFYRYIWDGQVAISGQHPFAQAPEEVEVGEIETDPEQLAAAELVYDRVNHPHVKTIYPTMAQVSFAVNVALHGWNPRGFHLTMLLVDGLLMMALYVCLVLARLPRGLLLGYAWCPLVLKEGLNSAHVDLVCALFLAVFMIAILRRATVLAAVALAGAAFVKLTPVVLAPLVVGWIWRGQSRAAALRWSAMFAAICVLLALPLVLGVPAPLEGLQAFSRDWIMNGSIYELVLLVLGDDGGWTKALLLGLFGCGVCWAATRVKSEQQLVRACMWTLAWLFLIGPVGNPWYLLWCLPFWLLVRSPSLLVLFAVTSLYYLNFHIAYVPGSRTRYAVLQTAEYLPFYLFLAVRGVSWLRAGNQVDPLDSTAD